jgi:hypothetical protein
MATQAMVKLCRLWAAEDGRLVRVAIERLAESRTGYDRWRSAFWVTQIGYDEQDAYDTARWAGHWANIALDREETQS